MIVASNSAVQTLAPGQSIIFDAIIMRSNECNCCVRRSSVKITHKGIHTISFSGNIGSTTAETDAELSIEVGGEVLPETRMISTSTAAGELNNVSTTTKYKVCCSSFSVVKVTNTGTITINVDANTSLVVD